MAEVSPENVSVLFANLCPFCSERMSSQFLLGKHLLAKHNICVNTNMKRNANEDWQKERMYFNATGIYPEKLTPLTVKNFVVNSTLLFFYYRCSIGHFSARYYLAYVFRDIYFMVPANSAYFVDLFILEVLYEN